MQLERKAISTDAAYAERNPRDVRTGLGSVLIWHQLNPYASTAFNVLKNLIQIVMGCLSPLWVKSRHVQRKRSCPLYARKRTRAAQLVMSALGQNRTLIHRCICVWSVSCRDNFMGAC